MYHIKVFNFDKYQEFLLSINFDKKVDFVSLKWLRVYHVDRKDSVSRRYTSSRHKSKRSTIPCKGKNARLVRLLDWRLHESVTQRQKSSIAIIKLTPLPSVWRRTVVNFAKFVVKTHAQNNC